MANSEIVMSLKALRINKEITQQFVAKKLGVTSRTIANWEAGRTYPDLKQLKDLEELYCVPLTAFRL